MLSRQSKLMDILTKTLMKERKLINKEKDYKISLKLYNKINDGLNEDFNNIIKTNLTTLKLIIDDFNLDEGVKEKLKKDIEVICAIIKMNKENDTYIELTREQQKSIIVFKANIVEQIEVLKQNGTNETHEYLDKQNYINAMELMLNRLSNRNNDKIIENTSLIKKVLEETNTLESDKQKIMLSLMKYNREIYLNESKESVLKEYLGEALREEDVIKIFNKFGYDFNKLNNDVKTNILNYGELNNINEVFDCLNGFKFPHINEETEGNKLFALLVGSTFETINNNTINAMAKKLTPEDLLKIPASLVKERKDLIIYRKKHLNDENTVSIDLDKLMNDKNFLADNEEAFDLLRGSSLDFIANLEFLDDNSFDINYIFKKCKQLLTLNHNLLETNINLFGKYGFPIDCSKDKITNQTFSALLSNNMAEIADQFIEIHPLGLEYIRNNQSALKEYSSAKDIVFYRIFLSLTPVLNDRKIPVIENAFKEVKSGSKSIIQLNDEITRKNKLYKDKEYRNLNEENKVERTNTYINLFKDEDEYKIIIKNNYKDISLSILENEYIKKLEIYTDPVNPIIYNFKGSRISKLKVLRIFSILLDNGVKESKESLMYSITYNSIITEKDYYKIDDIIDNLLEEVL